MDIVAEYQGKDCDAAVGALSYEQAEDPNPRSDIRDLTWHEAIKSMSCALS